MLDVDQLETFLRDKWIDQFADFTKLEIDSLKTYWDGRINASFQGFETSSDTIKTFEYDDDFNKVEVEEVIEIQNPNYSVQLGMGQDGFEYLKRKKAVVEENDLDVLAIMPLAKTYCLSENEGLTFYTNTSEMDLEKSQSKLELFISIQALRGSLLEEIPILKGFNSINLKILNDNEVEGKIEVKGDRNAIVALMKG